MQMTKLLGIGLLLAVGASAHFVYAQDAKHPYGHPSPRAKNEAEGKEVFVANYVEKRATITLHADIDTVWALFDPINESKWADGWNPEVLHPKDRIVQEGMVFRVHGTVWVVTRYDSENHHITYTVNHPEKVYTINVQCAPHGASSTDATITYSYVGLTEAGNELIEQAAARMFANDLKGWQMLINHYLKTGETLPLDQHGSERGHEKLDPHTKEGQGEQGSRKGAHAVHTPRQHGGALDSGGE